MQTRPVLAMGFVGVLAQVSEFDIVDRAARRPSSIRCVPGGGPWPERPPAGLVVVDEAGWRALPASAEMYAAALALAQGRLVRHRGPRGSRAVALTA